jgi:hypothetical protein
MKRQEAEIQDPLHPAQANLVYIFACFQSLKVTSTQSECPLAPKSQCLSKYVLNWEQNFSIRINRNRIIEGLLYNEQMMRC